MVLYGALWLSVALWDSLGLTGVRWDSLKLSEILWGLKSNAHSATNIASTVGCWRVSRYSIVSDAARMASIEITSAKRIEFLGKRMPRIVDVDVDIDIDIDI